MVAAVLDLLAFRAAGLVLGALTFDDRRLCPGQRLLAGALGFVAAWIYPTQEA